MKIALIPLFGSSSLISLDWDEFSSMPLLLLNILIVVFPITLWILLDIILLGNILKDEIIEYCNITNSKGNNNLIIISTLFSDINYTK